MICLIEKKNFYEAKMNCFSIKRSMGDITHLSNNSFQLLTRLIIYLHLKEEKSEVIIDIHFSIIDRAGSFKQAP